MTDTKIDLDKIVLQQPWRGGYGGFDSVSEKEFGDRTPRPPRNQPQLRYDPEIDALTILAGVHTVYDDNGYYDAGWDILPSVQRLAIPDSSLVDLIRNRKFGDVTVPSELTEQSGKRTFDFTPNVEQYDTIENMKELDENVIPRSYGNISCNFLYGTVALTLIHREDDKMGLVVNKFTPDSNITRDKRDLGFFNKTSLCYLQEFKKYIVFYVERSVGPQCNTDYVRLVESPVLPTQDLLRENRLMPYAGTCHNASYPGCEDCGGSTIIDFRVEDYSPERAKQLGLVEKLYSSEGIDSCHDNYLHRLTPKINHTINNRQIQS